jgi:hypothetical protein
MKTENMVTTEEIREAVSEVNGFQYMADRPLTNHPDDWYLRMVLARREQPREEYVTWVYNASIGGLHEGRYTRDQRQAMDDFHTRA